MQCLCRLVDIKGIHLFIPYSESAVYFNIPDALLVSR